MKNKNVLVITIWSYNDALIQTYTLPYLKIIAEKIPENSKIYLVTLEKDLNMFKGDKDSKIEVIPFQYKKFGFSGVLMWCKLFFYLLLFLKKNKISHIHSWCTPAGGLAYLLRLFHKSKLILDSFEPHAEPMVEGGTWKKNSIAYKILFLLEKLQLNKADEVICTVEGMASYSQQKYGIIKDRYFSKPACVDLNLFSNEKNKNVNLLKNLNLTDSIICVYAGKFGGLYLEKETFEFFKVAEDYFGTKFKVLLLTSHSDIEIEEYVKNAGLKFDTIVKNFVPYSEVSDYIGLADFSICPMKPLPSRRFGTPIKNGEYWALGLPIVITKGISDDSEIIENSDIGYVLKDLSKIEYLNAVKKIDKMLLNNSKKELYEKIRPIAEKYRNFKIAEDVYRIIYKN